MYSRTLESLETIESHEVAKSLAYAEFKLPPTVQEFAMGLEGVRPDAAVVAVASRILEAAIEKTVEPEFTVDVDGALSFDLRLSNGMLLLAELGIDGSLAASVFDDGRGVLIKYLPRTNDSELISLFE